MFLYAENLGVQICPYRTSKQVSYYNSKTWLNMLGQRFSNHVSSFLHWMRTNTAVHQTLCAKLNTHTNTDLVALNTAEQPHQTSDHSLKELNVTIIMLVGDFGHRYRQHVRHMDHLHGLWKQNTDIPQSSTVSKLVFYAQSTGTAVSYTHLTLPTNIAV